MGEGPKYVLEDILNKKKAEPQVLDLHGIKIENEEDFRKAMEKVPDYKIRAEKVRGFDQTNFPEDTKKGKAVGPGLFSGRDQPYQFADPCPPSMRQVRISDLSSVDISWKMLTLARPKTKIEEDIFSKLVQLDKLRLATRQKEEAALLARGGKDPFIVIKNPSESRGGVTEKYIKVCHECGEEFCMGSCIIFQYDSYQRIVKEPDEDLEMAKQAEAEKKKKKGKKLTKKRKKKNTKGDGPPGSITNKN